MAIAGEIPDKAQAVSQTYLDLAGQCNHPLATRGVMPVSKVSGLGHAEHYPLRRLQRRQVRVRFQVHLLDV